MPLGIRIKFLSISTAMMLSIMTAVIAKRLEIQWDRTASSIVTDTKYSPITVLTVISVRIASLGWRA
jgi:hypothetical protein